MGPGKQALFLGEQKTVPSIILAVILATVTKSTYTGFFKHIQFFLIIHFEQRQSTKHKIAANGNPHVTCPSF